MKIRLLSTLIGLLCILQGSPAKTSTVNDCSIILQLKRNLFLKINHKTQEVYREKIERHSPRPSLSIRSLNERFKKFLLKKAHKKTQSTLASYYASAQGPLERERLLDQLLGYFTKLGLKPSIFARSQIVFESEPADPDMEWYHDVVRIFSELNKSRPADSPLRLGFQPVQDSAFFSSYTDEVITHAGMFSGILDGFVPDRPMDHVFAEEFWHLNQSLRRQHKVSDETWLDNGIRTKDPKFVDELKREPVPITKSSAILTAIYYFNGGVALEEIEAALFSADVFLQIGNEVLLTIKNNDSSNVKSKKADESMSYFEKSYDSLLRSHLLGKYIQIFLKQFKSEFELEQNKAQVKAFFGDHKELHVLPPSSNDLSVQFIIGHEHRDRPMATYEDIDAELRDSIQLVDLKIETLRPKAAKIKTLLIEKLKTIVPERNNFSSIESKQGRFPVEDVIEYLEKTFSN